MARIGVNALYLIPGGVGGTEIYLRELLAALAEIDHENEYFVFTNLETGADLVPRQSNFMWRPQAVRASFRPARIVWEQVILPLEAARYKIDVLFNPGFTAPLISPCPLVTTFHDLQHKRHPERSALLAIPFMGIRACVSPADHSFGGHTRGPAALLPRAAGKDHGRSARRESAVFQTGSRTSWFWPAFADSTRGRLSGSSPS
jgi:hypothetical protein